MLKRLFTFTALAAGIALVGSAVPTDAFTASPRSNTLTFSGPVALPGVVLGAGSYVFESGPLETNRNIVRVVSTNYQRVYLLGMTNSVPRPRSLPRDQVLLMGEAGPGRATPVRAWYPVGSPAGFEFSYR